MGWNAHGDVSPDRAPTVRLYVSFKRRTPLPLPDPLKVMLGLLLLVLLGLSFLARKYPHVRGLQAFALHGQLGAKQRTRLGRTQNRTAGAELMLLGVILPLAYVGFKAVFFGEIPSTAIVLVGVSSAACIVLGLVALIRK